MPKCTYFVKAQHVVVEKEETCNLKSWQPGQDKMMLALNPTDDWDRADCLGSRGSWVCLGTVAFISGLQQMHMQVGEHGHCIHSRTGVTGVTDVIDRCD